MFPEAANQPSPTDQREYQRNLERIQQELSGFRPIDKPVDKPVPSGGVMTVKSHAKTRNPSKKKAGSRDSVGSDPLAGSDYY